MGTILLNTFLSLVAGILGSLAVAPIQRWLSKRSEHARKKALKATEEEYQNVMWHASHPDQLAPLLITRVMFMVLGCVLGLVILLLNGTLEDATGIVPIFHPRTYVRVVVLALDVATKIFVMAVAIRYVWNLTAFSHNVCFFESYIESVPESIRDHEMEDAIIDGRRLRRCIAVPPDEK